MFALKLQSTIENSPKNFNQTKNGSFYTPECTELTPLNRCSHCGPTVRPTDRLWYVSSRPSVRKAHLTFSLDFGMMLLRQQLVFHLSLRVVERCTSLLLRT